MNVIEFLDKVITFEDQAGTYRTRIVKTLGEGVKILTAVNAIQDLGETEKAVISRTLTIAEKLAALLGATA